MSYFPVKPVFYLSSYEKSAIMCFSATASIAAGSLLAVSGYATLKKSNIRSQFAFASIPLVFAVQQFTEAFVWLSLNSVEFAGLKTISVLSFLFFAQIVWPVFVPLSIYTMESDTRKRRILFGFSLLGLAFSLYMAFNMYFYPVNAIISGYHIRYDLIYPPFIGEIGGWAYFTACVLSLFVSSVPRMKILGFAVLAAFLITKFYFAETLISVWCYFAAIDSAVIFYILHGLVNEENKPALSIS